MDDEMHNKIEERIIKPTVAGLINEGIKYKGFIFIGLINVNGNPYVIEYNVRMGDPETQVVLPRIKNDFLEILLSIENQNLDQVELEIDPKHYTNVVLASKGYPESYNKGFIITGLEKINRSIVFHAGTLLKGNVLTNGGRVISLVSSADNFKKALKKTYESIDLIEFEGKTYRKDIGFDL
jgi:phosphoribosylamine--glycine ligase